MKEYNPSQFTDFRNQIKQSGGSIFGPVTLSDAIAPDGSPDTSCRQLWDQQLKTDQVIKVITPLAQSLTRVEFYLVFPPAPET